MFQAEINKAAGPEFNTRVAETKLGAKLLAKLMGLDHWSSVKKFKDVSAGKMVVFVFDGLLCSKSITFKIHLIVHIVKNFYDRA